MGTSWVNKGSASVSDSKKYATITIPGGVSGEGVTYEVQKVTYTAGGGTLYTLEQDFYYITSSEVVVPDYRSAGLEPSLFSVVYKPQQTEQTLDLTKGFKVWTMSAGSLTNTGDKEFGSAGSEAFTTTDGVTKPAYNVSTDKKTATVTISKAVLDNYKKHNPNKSYYPTISARFYVNGKYYSCDIVFALADYVTVDATFTNANQDLTVDLNGAVCVPVRVGDALEYQDLTTDHKYSIYETEYLKTYENGVLIFNSAKIAEYFDKGNDELRILCELTTQDGTIEFEVVIQNKLV